MTLFEAEITPYRSLSRWGTAWLIGSLFAISFGVTLLFWHLGAWPIAGFNGGETLLAVLLLRLNARDRRAVEFLTLSETELSISRCDARGRRSSASLPAAWLKMVLEERPGRVPRLLLVQRQQREEVAAGLGEAEKRDLAAALGDALRAMREPRLVGFASQTPHPKR